MSFFKKEYGFTLDGRWIEILGETKLIYPRWRILVDGEIRDEKSKRGALHLSTKVNDSEIRVDIYQSWFGDFWLTAYCDEKKMFEFNGFLA